MRLIGSLQAAISSTSLRAPTMILNMMLTSRPIVFKLPVLEASPSTNGASRPRSYHYYHNCNTFRRLLLPVPNSNIIFNPCLDWGLVTKESPYFLQKRKLLNSKLEHGKGICCPIRIGLLPVRSGAKAHLCVRTSHWKFPFEVGGISTLFTTHCFMGDVI